MSTFNCKQQKKIYFCTIIAGNCLKIDDGYNPCGGNKDVYG